MKLRYKVELTTKETFTASINIDLPSEAENRVILLDKINKKLKYNRFNNPILYDNYNNIIKKYKL